jgi:hypothetical protein
MSGKPSTNVGSKAMAKNTKFKPRQSGNPEARFKPGNPHRWQPGQSGNPSGIARSRLRFEEAFYATLIGQGAPEEAASILWECFRAREPWAIQAILQRLAPPTQQIKLTHEVEDGQAIDYTRLADEEIEQLERLLNRATTPVAAIESGESQTELEAICDTGVADPGTGD